MIQFQHVRSLLREFRFQDAFRELGWANPPALTLEETSTGFKPFRP